MPAKLTTYIRRAGREDLDTIVGWMEDPDFVRFLYGDPARSQRQVREQIVALLGRAKDHTMPGGIYLLIDSKESGPVGILSLQHISWRNRCATVDLYVGAKELRSRAVAGIATFRALEYCFDELNLHRVQAFIYDFNRPSWRLLERTGAQRELTLRRHVMRDGESHDVYGYGLLRREFEAFRAGLNFPGMSLRDMVEALGLDQDAGAETAP
jgi:RimJ/RimL family protein N-acetyltransferase